MKSLNRIACATTLTALLAAGIACKKDATHAHNAPPPSPADVEAKLAAADAKDGAVDKTIHGCLMCGLRMEGSADHTSTHAGYTLHFCSADCKEHFDEHPDTSIAALDVEP